MSKGRLEETEGIDISISSYFHEKTDKNRLSSATIKTLERELSRPHLVYDHIALTDNYLIAMSDGDSPNGIFTCIKYDDLVWLYIGEWGGLSTANVIRVLSLAKGVTEKNAKKAAKVVIATDLFTNVLSTAMIGLPTNGNQSIMIAFSKDRTAIVATDAKSRMLSSKSSKDFSELLSTIIERGPENLMVGDQYEDAYCEMMGIDIYKSNGNLRTSSAEKEVEKGDGGDELL